MKRRLLIPTLLAVASLASQAQSVNVPAGRYVLEKTHASLLWRVKHMGMSNYTARFTRFDVALDFDPKRLTRSSVEAVIDMSSIETDYVPGTDGRDWNQELRGATFFNVVAFPAATFRSTKVTPAGAQRLRIDGELSFLGVSKPVTLQARLNGSMASHPFAKVPALGFSATGRFKRTDFGLNPPPLQQGVSDEVELIIEAEFLRQP